MELRQMRQVLALAEHGSFARAAVALRLSQPALSRSIQLLEQQIGAALFLRSTAGVVPTDIGRLLVQRSRQVVQMAEDLDHEVQSNRTLRSGQLSVGSGPYPLESVITTALERFIAAHPAIGVRVQVRDWDELVPRLRSRELDLFVAEISTLKNEPDLEVAPMDEHALYFVGRHAHPLAGRDNVTAAETFTYPFIAPARIPPRLLAPMLQARRKAAGRKDPPHAFPALECNAVAAVKRIVESSDAVTALTLSCCAAELQQHRLALLGTKPWLSTRYGIVSLKGLPMSSAALRFREVVAEAQAEVAPFEDKVLALWKSRSEASAPARRASAQASQGFNTRDTGAGRRR
jgi:DNA-binding transcriptional LysR family regulator